jgi:hypothetical protein
MLKTTENVLYHLWNIHKECQYGCLFSRCRKYVIKGLIPGHFQIDQVIIPRPILALESVSGQYGGLGMMYVIKSNKHNCRIPIPLEDIMTITPFPGLVQALNNKHWCLVSLRCVSCGPRSIRASTSSQANMGVSFLDVGSM